MIKVKIVMNNKKKKLYATKMDYLVVLVLSIYFLLTLTVPFFAQVTNARLSMLVTVALLGILMISNFSRHFLFIVPICSVLALDVLYRLIHMPSSVPLFMYGRFIWLLPTLLSYFIIYNKQLHNAKFLLKFTLITLTITALTSYYGLLTDPFAARIAATISDSRDPYAISLNLRNIGGFSIVYTIVAVYPMVVALKKFHVINTITFIIITASFTSYVFIAQYTTALIIFTLGVLSILFSKKYESYKVIIVGLVSITLFIIFKSFIAEAIYFVADLVDSIVLTERLSYMGDVLSGKDVGNNSTQLRFTLFQNAIDTIKTYPLTGIWLRSFHTGSLSGHSFILDALAKYGLLGIIALGIFYRHIYKRFYLPFKKKPFYGYMVFCFMISIVLGVLNPIDSLFTFAFIVPLAGFIIDNKINQNESTL